MDRRCRALVAIQPPAWPRLRTLLPECVEPVPVHTVGDAMALLERDPQGFDLIVCSLTFSDSRMLDFLVTVKADPRLAGIPFVCCRVLVGIVSETLVERLGNAAKLCGAAEFVNMGGRPEDEARAALDAAVRSCLTGDARAGQAPSS